MAHLALYRTYRPKDFDAVVGQKHIIQTMRNQIKNDLLSHAYVLTGPRGTGKTSIARIVAKAINCTNLQNANPCNACESCLAVNQSNHPDVLELDGASNNGVEEIRDLRAGAKYSASLSPFKVYIIDEVHMLSTAAFNALLKTLEEPPPHVIFILATTEIHKVPETILSRVQRFDLLQIPAASMSDHLIRILDELGIGFEEGVPELIATLAAGGLRDALSMLDQAIAYTTDIVKLADIHDLNGSVDATALVEIIECVMASNSTGVVASTRALLAGGKLPARIIDGLLGLLRDVLKAQKVGTKDGTGLAGKLSSQQILAYIKQLNNLTYNLRIATDAQLILEVGLIELGLEDEFTSRQVAEISTTEDYAEQIQHLTLQVADLKAEVVKLKSQQLAVTTTPQAPVTRTVPQKAEPDGVVPIYVQGELVQDDAFDGRILEAVDQSNDTHAQRPDSPLLIEEILDNATKQDKVTLVNKLTAANPFANLDVKEIVMLLKDADIAAASPAGCILVYDYETTAQKLLTDESREKTHAVLANMMDRAYGFLALPKDFWLVKRKSYLAQSKQEKKVVLEQYPQRVCSKALKKGPTDEQVPFYQDVVDMFGDVVEVSE